MHAAAVRNNRKPTPPSWTASFSADLPPFLQLSLYCARVTSELLSSRTNVRDLKISPYGRNDRNPGFQPFAVQKVSKKSLNTSSREVFSQDPGCRKKPGFPPEACGNDDSEVPAGFTAWALSLGFLMPPQAGLPDQGQRSEPAGSPEPASTGAAPIIAAPGQGAIVLSQAM